MTFQIQIYNILVSFFCKTIKFNKVKVRLNNLLHVPRLQPPDKYTNNKLKAKN